MTGKTLMPISESTSKPLGLCWLLACLGFGPELVGYWLRHDWWMATALGSIALSQPLIILYWPDPKAGTTANVLIAVEITLTYARGQFSRQADDDARKLLNQSPLDQTLVTPDKLTGLPTPVKQWLTEAGVVSKEQVRTVRHNKCEVVVVSLGSGEAMLVTADEQDYVLAPPVMLISTAYTGDSLVEGMVHALSKGQSYADMIRLGVACGTAATMINTELFNAPDVDPLVEWLNQHRQLEPA